MRIQKLCKILVIVCAGLLVTVAASRAASYDRPGLVAKFDAMDLSLNNGEGFSADTNETGNLAWGESYLLEAYLDMYEKTQNVKYLRSFVRHADRVVANTDKKRGVADYKGRSAIAWSSTKYSLANERVVWLVHSGMITYPLVRFAMLVDKYKLDAYRSQAQQYTEQAKSAMAFFDQNWVYDAASGKGYYQYSSDEPQKYKGFPLSFNEQLAAGRTFLLLYKVTGSAEYRKKAEGLARHFRAALGKGSDGSYTWHYWYGSGYDAFKAFEDISHGAIDLDFAVLAYRSGVVFNRVDMTRLLQTYSKRVRKGNNFADRVDGSGEGTYKDSIGKWLELTEFGSLPWKDFYALFSSGALSNHPQVMLGVAKLIKFYDQAKK